MFTWGLLVGLTLGGFAGIVFAAATRQWDEQDQLCRTPPKKEGQDKEHHQKDQ